MEALMTNTNMALRRAKQVANATTYKEKVKAVKAWCAAVKVMLNG